MKQVLRCRAVAMTTALLGAFGVPMESSPGESGSGIAVNSAGNACVTGMTASTEFRATTGAIRSFNSSGIDTSLGTGRVA